MAAQAESGRRVGAGAHAIVLFCVEAVGLEDSLPPAEDAGSFVPSPTLWYMTAAKEPGFGQGGCQVSFLLVMDSLGHVSETASCKELWPFSFQ